MKPSFSTAILTLGTTKNSYKLTFNMYSKDSLSQSIKANSVIEAVIEAIPAPVFYKHEDGRYLGCNIEFERFVGKTKAEILGKSVFELWDPELANVYDEADTALFKKGGKQLYEAQVKYADGSLRDVLFHKAVFNVEGELNGLVGVMLDITARNEAERQLRQAAETDSLTGLYNRAFFYKHFAELLAKSGSDCSGCALLALDLDYLKSVNDKHGHLVGDLLIKQTAQRIKNAIREHDIVARVGGDEFLVLLRNIKSEQTAKKIADILLLRVNGSPIQASGKLINVSVSIGMLCDFSPDYSIDEILQKLDEALYRAKSKRNTVSK